MVKENALASIEVASLSELLALGEVFFQSGMFTDIKSQAQAVVKILKGRELGLAPLESMDNIFIVSGRTSCNSHVIASLIKRSKKYDYRIDKLDNTECHLTFFKDGKEEGKSSFTFKDAALAGLANRDTYKNYPRNMLFSRALTNGSRWFCPEVFSGYTPDEIENVTPQDDAKMIQFSEVSGEVVTAEEPQGEVK